MTPRCEVCGNERESAFYVVVGARKHTFDCLECAATVLASVCPGCGCRILGHGSDRAGRTYCSERCAERPARLEPSVRPV